ncbi:DMT family transporter, partial [Candidatus Bipolaricaulota bacterium]|nr:DMT family transporter [Candidatus Bipolaricaulota bacterium]
MLTGQVIAGLVISQYGWLGSAMRPINGWNILGVLLVIMGAIFTVIGH